MNLKQLLGENFRDGMTVEELLKAAENVDPTAGYVSKDMFDRTASELAAKKKELREKRTADEQAAAEAAEAAASRDQEFNSMKRELSVMKQKAKVMSIPGFDEKSAEAMATAMVDGDTEKATSLFGAAMTAREAALRTEILNSTPRPNGSSVSTSGDYSKMIADAQAAGDYAAAAYYTRLAGEQQS